MATASRSSARRRFRLLGWRQLLILLLVGLVMASALAVITSAHMTRVQYARLQQLERHKDKLQTEWGQLLLEESTWSAPSRIERLASERLDMHVPELSEIKVIRP
ncbi:cell division protein FtsL [Modicisalibacter xianhensis]|uniref:Cell division protein FtsL n=1 Tax=Modicisalibacter xianhensis TaxID=442341 RepID=A0A1I3BZB1_9GAMM|nr:cell division protein FtsL [Halomonas xianhensis]TDX30275.1 cell division protein FtsL [Halomonas xianhensis]SFH67550.1 cell division protein FtsL [Halomonas xianhensis]